MNMKEMAVLLGIGLASVTGSVYAAESVSVEKGKKEVVATADLKENKTFIKHGKEVFNGSCVGCHGMNGEGGVGPKLAGQSAKDIAEKLKHYKAGEQMGPMTSMMAPMAAGLSEEDIRDISLYISTLQ